MQVFDDVEFDAQLGRTLIAAHARAADLGEALATAGRITAGDHDSWSDEWAATARRAHASAGAALAAGHPVTAAGAFLRASEYWRQSFFFHRHDIASARVQDGWAGHRDAFRAALPLLGLDVDRADIPFEAATLGAYLFRAPTTRPGAGRPVVLLPCGFDSTAEAGYVATGYMALRHGYDVLCVEGPGQGGMLYDQHVAMRPDFEVVLRAVVDWLVGREDVDASRLAVIGRSFAGYLAPRGVSGEPRIAALVVDPGQYDFVSRIVGRQLDEVTWAKVLAADPTTDAELEHLRDDPHGREYCGARMATQGAATVGDFLRMQPGYTLRGRAELITCPTLVTEGEGDFASQGDRLVAALGAPVTVHRFAAADGGGGHCEGLGATLFEDVVFDWLDETLG